MRTTKTMRISGTQGAVVELSMYISDCPDCGVVFGITSEYERHRREDGAVFHCPNGHVMSWRKAVEDKRLEKQLAIAQETSERYQAALRREREEHKATERSLSATKGVVTRQRNRAHAALCPVDGCKRTIVQMKRHLETKHPDYVPVQP